MFVLVLVSRTFILYLIQDHKQMILLKKLHRQHLISPLQQRIVQLYHSFQQRNDPKNKVFDFKCKYTFLYCLISGNIKNYYSRHCKHIFFYTLRILTASVISTLFLHFQNILSKFVNFTISICLSTMKNHFFALFLQY